MKQFVIDVDGFEALIILYSDRQHVNCYKPLTCNFASLHFLTSIRYSFFAFAMTLY